jgi:hypothetical protein
MALLSHSERKNDDVMWYEKTMNFNFRPFLVLYVFTISIFPTNVILFIQ